MKPNQQISARATGLLLDCVALNTRPTIHSLWGRFSEGRGAVETALKELEEAGYLARQLGKTGNRPQTTCEVTQAGYEYVAEYLSGFILGLPEISSRFSGSQFLAQISGKLSKYTNHSNLTSKTIKRNHSERNEDAYETQVIDVSGWDGLFSSTDSTADEQKFESERLKLDASRKAHETKQRDKQTSNKSRFGKPFHLWSAENVAHEFIDRSENLFNVPPWQASTAKFKAALSTQRKKHGTNGEIEIALMELYFETIKGVKIQNSDHLWARWFTLWPQLLLQAQAMTQSEEQHEEAKAQAERSQEKLRG